MLLQAEPLIAAMRDHQWIFPALEVVHIASFALAIGTIAATDFSLLGFGFPRKEASEVLRKTDLWTMLGLVLIIFSGILIFMTDADDYVVNKAFQVKMTFLVLAIVFNYTVHRKITLAANASAGVVKSVAAVSLFLWIGVVFGGLFIAFQ